MPATKLTGVTKTDSETSAPGQAPKPAIPAGAAAALPVAAVAPTSKALVVTEKLSAPGPTAPKPRATRQPRPVPGIIPAILLEPDHVPSEDLTITGPGARFELAQEPHAPAPTAPVIPIELPESYGTEQIFLAARDPYWLLASWDLDARQRDLYNHRSATGTLAIRLRRDHGEGPIHLEVHTRTDSRDWFLHAGSPDTTFVAELGYHEKNSGNWKRISISKPATTPRDRAVSTSPAPPTIASDPSPLMPAPVPVRAADPSPTPPPQPPTHEEIVFVQATSGADATLGRPETDWTPSARFSASTEEKPAQAPVPTYTHPASTPRWSATQAKALDELISLELKKSQFGSLEIEEVLRRRVTRMQESESVETNAPSSLALVESGGEEFLARALGLARAGGPSSIEAAPVAAKGKGFWFKVNAELIVYGSTEPDAQVTIGGRPVRLREDGSFSFRFALPDGSYALPVLAISRDGEDGRAAELSFFRGTRYSGEVQAHPQDHSLKTPSPASI